MPTATRNADPAELGKFDALAQRWWDPHGEFAPLHRLNPVRVGYIAARTRLAGAAVLDVGCGGGILSESLARAGARVTGIDLAARALEVAELHALEQGVSVAYRLISVEELAAERPASFDVVTCMEMLEHVPDAARVMQAIARLVRPGGEVFVATLNRTLRSFALAIVGAEYLLRLLPRGTHEHARFIRPSELARHARTAGLVLRDITGVQSDLLAREFRLGADASVNYLAQFSCPGTGAT